MCPILINRFCCHDWRMMHILNLHSGFTHAFTIEFLKYWNVTPLKKSFRVKSVPRYQEVWKGLQKEEPHVKKWELAILHYMSSFQAKTRQKINAQNIYLTKLFRVVGVLIDKEHHHESRKSSSEKKLALECALLRLN